MALEVEKHRAVIAEIAADVAFGPESGVAAESVGKLFDPRCLDFRALHHTKVKVHYQLMARILLAWEVGVGLGHVIPLRVLADGLSARGHHVVMLLRRHTTCFAAPPHPYCRRRPRRRGRSSQSTLHTRSRIFSTIAASTMPADSISGSVPGSRFSTMYDRTLSCSITAPRRFSHCERPKQ